MTRLLPLALLAGCAPGQLFGPAERQQAARDCGGAVIQTAAPDSLSAWARAQYPRVVVRICAEAER